MDEVGTAPGVLPHIETLGDRELFEQNVALRDGRLPEDAHPAIVHGDRLGAIGRMSGEIVERDVPAHRCESLGDARTKDAAVERGGAVRDHLAERLREILLLQDLAGAREASARTEDARALFIEARTAVDESFGEAIAHREP